MEESNTANILEAHLQGDPRAASKLLPVIYQQLREIAVRQMRGERADHSLNPTAVVHEAYLRLIGLEKRDWRSRSHFLAMAATTLRRVLIDHARARNTEKRGHGHDRVSWSQAGLLESPTGDPLDLLDLSESLQVLERRNERQARVVELRFFAGLTVDEAAAVLGVGRDAVKDDWRMARAWLLKRLTRDGPNDGEGGER